MSHEDLYVTCDGDLVLTGDLVGSERDRACLLVALRYMVDKYTHIVVDASKMRIIPEGYELWLELVNSAQLKTITLEYVDSQLAEIIKYDDHYVHQKTILPKN